DTDLLERGLDPAGRADPLAFPAKHRMSFQPVERQQPQPLPHPAAFGPAGAEMEAIAVADLVELQPVVEVAHPTLPPITARSSKPLRPSLNRRSASLEKVTADSISGGSSR